MIRVSLMLPKPTLDYITDRAREDGVSVAEVARAMLKAARDAEIAKIKPVKPARKTTTTVVAGDDPGDHTFELPPTTIVEPTKDPLDPGGYWLTHAVDAEGNSREPGRPYSYDGWPQMTAEEDAASRCPKCGGSSYSGGECYDCDVVEDAAQ